MSRVKPSMHTASVDLSSLAIDRQPLPGSGSRGHLVTRYLIPLFLAMGFLAILVWAGWDRVFPARAVTVIPVLSTQSGQRAAGAPLFNAAGWIEPRPTPIRVPGLAAGVVEELLVVEDQLVQAGDPVAELIKDDAELTWQMALADEKLRGAELDHARAAVAAAETRFAQPVHLQAQLAEAEASLATIQTELANLPFELQRARSRLKFAMSDLQRNMDARDSVSRREFEDAQTLVETMQAMVDELQLRKSSLASQEKAIGMRRDALQVQLDLLVDEIQARDQALAQVAMAEARLKQSQVAVAEARLQLDRMTVRAPIDGRVLLLVGQPGTRIGGMRDAMSEMVDGSTVVTMYRPDRLQVKVDVRFQDLPQVQLGQPVQINNPALAEPLTGSVLFISSEADIQKNTLEVKVAIDQPPPVLRPEMLVDVTFQAAEAGLTQPQPAEGNWQIYIPQKLVQESPSGPQVWVADRAAGRALLTPVTTGEKGPDGTVEITSGLDLSSRLITSAADSLHDGLRIRITEAPE